MAFASGRKASQYLTSCMERERRGRKISQYHITFSPQAPPPPRHFLLGIWGRAASASSKGKVFHLLKMDRQTDTAVRRASKHACHFDLQEGAAFGCVQVYSAIKNGSGPVSHKPQHRTGERCPIGHLAIFLNQIKS